MFGLRVLHNKNCMGNAYQIILKSKFVHYLRFFVKVFLEMNEKKNCV